MGVGDWEHFHNCDRMIALPQAGTICGTFVQHKSGLNFFVLFVFLRFATNCDKIVVNLALRDKNVVFWAFRDKSVII